MSTFDLYNSDKDLSFMHIILTDQTGRRVSIPKKVERIVSLVPSLTELVVDLGLRTKIVGITKFCVHPEDLRQSTVIIGGTKNVRIDKIKSLAPDIIIANKEENTLQIVSQLEKIAPVWVTDIANERDNLITIADFGKIFNRQKEAADLVSRISLEQEKLSRIKTRFSSKKVLYLIWKNPYMAAGSGTYIDAMLRLNGFENYCANEMRYPEIDLDDINKNSSPDLIFLSSEPYPFKENDRRELEVPFPSANVVLVDGEMFSWYGSRALKAISYFHNRTVELGSIQ